jgi:hypothetical protein
MSSETLIRREDAIRVAEMYNDSIRAVGKFAEAINMIPPYPAGFNFENMSCPRCQYPIDSSGLCVRDANHTAAAAGL